MNDNEESAGRGAAGRGFGASGPMPYLLALHPRAREEHEAWFEEQRVMWEEFHRGDWIPFTEGAA